MGCNASKQASATATSSSSSKKGGRAAASNGRKKHTDGEGDLGGVSHSYSTANATSHDAGGPMMETTKSLLDRKISSSQPDRVYRMLLRAWYISQPQPQQPKQNNNNNNNDPSSSSSSITMERQILYNAVVDHLQKESFHSSRYQDPTTKYTPLHLVARLVNVDQNQPSAQQLVSVVDQLVHVYPTALSIPDSFGNIPFHYVIAPPPTSTTIHEQQQQQPQDWRARGYFVQHFLSPMQMQQQQQQQSTSSSSSSIERAISTYWHRNDVIYYEDNNNDSTSGGGASSNRGCSPLYRILQTLDDDFDPSGPTVEYVRAVLQSMMMMESSTTGPIDLDVTVDIDDNDNNNNNNMAGVGNASDGDKPLSLLYRRFTRQFDISEMFFAGDNSRPQVVEHRHKYKCAAGNTWKIIESCLLMLMTTTTTTSKKMKMKQQTNHGVGIVHRAVQMETPPDLLRYIVETNAQDLTKVDGEGNLPLHYAAMVKPPRAATSIRKYKSTSSSSSCSSHSSSGHFPAFYTKYVVDELLYKFPEAAGMMNGDGLYPLTLAISSGKQWIGGGIKSLYDAFPQALEQINLDEHEDLQRVLSLSQSPTDDDDDEEHKETGPTSEESLRNDDNGNTTTTELALKQKGIIRDEHHDAIMLVQQPNVDISEVTTSMWAHEEDAGVQMLGCIAICKLLQQAANKDDPTTVLRIALTATASVVNAMKAHPNEMIVQEKACLALSLLAPADGRREVSMVASGAVAAIVAAMQAHVGDANIQQEACAAIVSIVEYGGGDRATVVASVSGVTAILNAIAAHAQIEAVQKEGCHALLLLTDFSQSGEANLPELPKTQTEPLLLQAKDDFPDSCGPLVDRLLERMRNE